MKKYLPLALTIAVLALTSCRTTKTPHINVSGLAILIYNGNIIDVNDGSVLEHKAILIDSGMIKQIGAYAALKTNVLRKNQFDSVK